MSDVMPATRSEIGTQVDGFLANIPAINSVMADDYESVQYFGFFLTEVVGVGDITIVLLRECYEAAAVRTPTNLSRAVKNSGAFVETSKGRSLSREARARVAKSLKSDSSATGTMEAPFSVRKRHVTEVVVIHGRDMRARNSMFQFLRAVHLKPTEWNDAVRKTEQGTPYVGHVLESLFAEAQAFVVLLTPDEQVELSHEFRAAGEADAEGWQPRPNVYFEAGIAHAMDPSRTIIVQIGDIRPASDILGRHILRLDNSPEARNSLLQRLAGAGCELSQVGNDWLTTGDFEPRSPATDRARGAK